MAHDSVPPDINHAFLELKAAAKELNEFSDQLGKPVTALEALLKPLNLGISAWHRLVRHDDETGSGDYWFRDLGYAKVDRKWGIALREGSGDASGEEDCEAWLFNDAPRRLRVEAIDHLPALIQKLTAEAKDTSRKVRGKIDAAQKVVAAVAGPGAPSGQKK